MKTKSEGKIIERINWIKSKTSKKDCYVGYPVNMRSITAQADSLDELKTKIKSMMKIVIRLNTEMLEREDDCFELKEFTDLDEWLFQDTLEIRRKLARYEELYGELE